MIKQLISKISKSKILILPFLVFLIFNSVSAKGATFVIQNSQDPIIVPRSLDNVYGFGENITSSETIGKDLVLAGKNITITSLVTRGILVVGENININSSFVGASVRAAGQKVTISGSFRDDVILAADTIRLENAQISGDLLLTASTLIIDDKTKIEGKGYINYTKLENTTEQALEEAIIGDLNISKNEELRNDLGYRNFGQNFINQFNNFLWQIILIKQIGFGIALSLICWWLIKRNRLSNPKIGFNLKLLKNFVIGLIVPVVLLVLFIASLFLSTLPIFRYLSLVNIWFYLFSLAFSITGLAGIIAPIYLGNIIANATNNKDKLIWFVVLAFVLIFGLETLVFNFPSLIWLLIINYIIYTASSGLMIVGLIKSISKFLSNQNNQTSSFNDPKEFDGIGVIAEPINKTESFANQNPVAMPAIKTLNQSKLDEQAVADDYTIDQKAKLSKTKKKPVIIAKFNKNN